jgi:hypothetical protein
MDVLTVSEAVASIAATGAVSNLSGQAALDVVARIRGRLRAVLHRDERSLDAFACALEDPTDKSRIRELAKAVAWYAQHDDRFASELANWAQEFSIGTSISQKARAGRDTYTAGRDMTVNQRPEAH